MLIMGTCGAVLLTAEAPAAWAFEVHVDTSPATIRYYGPTDPRTTRSIEYRVSLTAGTEAEAVVVDVSNLGDGVVVAGPATLSEVSRSQGHGDPVSVRAPDACSVGALYFSSTRDEVMLPAGSTSTIAFTRTLALASVPLTAKEFVASFKIAPVTPGGVVPVESPLPGEVTFSSPTPKLAGLRSSQLDLRVGLAGSGMAVSGMTSLNVRRGSRMRISGTLKPARRGDSVTIWAYAPGATMPTQLAVANVDRHGRYQYLRWRPTTLGLWDLYATWRGRDAAVEPARSSCGGPHIVVGPSVLAHHGTSRTGRR
jgi:hypothetical protein